VDDQHVKTRILCGPNEMPEQKSVKKQLFTTVHCIAEGTMQTLQDRHRTGNRMKETEYLHMYKD